jgi:uncharacterized membrane protein YkgB
MFFCFVQEVQLSLLMVFYSCHSFDGDVIFLFFRFLVFPIISYYFFSFLHEVGAKDEIQHHYVNSNVLVGEGGIGVVGGIAHASVIANVVHNDLGVNGCFLTLHVSILISRVSSFDVVTWENTMAQVQQS